MSNAISKHDQQWTPFSNDEYECIVCYEAVDNENTFVDYWCECKGPYCKSCMSKMDKCPTCRMDNPDFEDESSDEGNNVLGSFLDQLDTDIRFMYELYTQQMMRQFYSR